MLMLVNFLPIQGVPHSSHSGLSESALPSSISDVHSMASGQVTARHTEDQASARQDKSQHSVEDEQSVCIHESECFEWMPAHF